MAIYNAVRGYDPQLSVRDYGELHQRLRELPPEGALWLLLAPRRYGKTWTLKALQHLLGEKAHYLVLRDPDHRRAWSRARPRAGEHWLLDEPLTLLDPASEATGGRARAARGSPDAQRAKGIKNFLSKCARLHEAGANVILALTPRELDLLTRPDFSSGRVSHKAIVRLPPLKPQDVRKQARTPDAQELLEWLPSAWTHTPFLVELIFQVDEQARNEGLPLGEELISRVLDACDATNHRYFHFVFMDGLTEDQRRALRAIAQGESADPRCVEVLEDAGLLERLAATGHHRLADPVISAHLTPLRIHHLSDIHVGPKSAPSIDAKESGPLAEAVDSGVVREGYLSHLEGLHARGEAPHLVIVSGDLTERATPEQCEEARRWLDRIPPLLEPHALLRKASPRVLLVGGNHDVDWNQVRQDDGRARHRPFAQAFAAYPHPHLEVPPEERKLATIAWPDLGLEILLLGTSELGGRIEEDVERYHLFQEMATLSKDPSQQDPKKAEDLATQAARIDPGLVHTRDLDRIIAHPWRQPVRIAILHHPPSPLPSTEVGRYAGLLNAGAVKQVLMEKGFCLALCGHVHSGLFAEERWPGRHPAPIRIAAAPSLGSREIAENNGYNVIEILRDRAPDGHRTHQITLRRIIRRGERSWAEAERLGPFTPGA